MVTKFHSEKRIGIDLEPDVGGQLRTLCQKQ